MLTESSSVDQITLDKHCSIFYRVATEIKRDDAVISTTYHRTSLSPGADLTGVPANVAAVATTVWTEDVLEAWANRSNTAQES
jgi:hypothetical protein